MYKGVTETNGKFKAQICRNGKVINLGMFDTDTEAAKAYDAESRKLNGVFTDKVNFPKLPDIDPKIKSIQTGTYKGVSFDEERQLWKTELNAYGFNIVVGYYKTEKLAAFWYDNEVTKYVGSIPLSRMPENERMQILNLSDDEFTSIFLKVVFNKEIE